MESWAGQCRFSCVGGANRLASPAACGEGLTGRSTLPGRAIRRLSKPSRCRPLGASFLQDDGSEGQGGWGSFPKTITPPEYTAGWVFHTRPHRYRSGLRLEYTPGAVRLPSHAEACTPSPSRINNGADGAASPVRQGLMNQSCHGATNHVWRATLLAIFTICVHLR